MNQPATLESRVDAMFGDGMEAIAAARGTLCAPVAAAAAALAAALADGGKVLICGNGGSAADSLHFSAELVNKYRKVRPALAAVSLAADVPTITSIANDDSYEAVFSRQVEALGRRGDMLVVITSSGNSPNLLRAVAAAHTSGLRCIALNGAGGGALSPRLTPDDIDIVVPHRVTARVQEIHGIIIHALCELIDLQLFGENQP